ncbi:MAG TPA: 6-phosphogluconolactonase [Vicinamibacterales bacterium]|nr:6-phosphogluconolactonase [Vicinamibacterales bacterium]
MSPDVRRFERLDELSREAAHACAEVMGDAVSKHGRCAIALAGGETPTHLYQLLASDHSGRIDWTRVHVFWSDERYVPADDARSNARMARHKLLDHVPCPPAQIHPMPTDAASPDEAATIYEQTLRQFFGAGLPEFDLMLLGLGTDGHTASLFPHSPALLESTRLVVPVATTADPPVRLTLTFPVLTAGRRIFVMAAGPAKLAALERVLVPDAEVDRHPAAALRTAGRRLTWWVARMG